MQFEVTPPFMVRKMFFFFESSLNLSGDLVKENVPFGAISSLTSCQHVNPPF